MEISHEEHTIQPNRIVQFRQKFNTTGVKAVITNPPGFENAFLTVSGRQNGCYATVPKFINSRRLNTFRVKIRVWNDSPAKIPEPVPEKPKETFKNPPPPKKKTKHKIGEMVKDWQGIALKKSQERAEIIASKRNHVQESVALKPVGLDGMKILTADDCDYSRGVAIIQNLIKTLAKHNEMDGNKSISQKKLLCEFYNVLSFSGASTIIGLYIALGDKGHERGNLEAFLKWYQIDLAKIYSPTSAGELLNKVKKFGEGFKPKQMRKNPNPGLSLKNVEKIIGKFFTNKNTSEPFLMKDLHCEVYQPMMLDDERTFVYSKSETPKAKLVDVIINTALDPNYFQTRKIEKMGISKGPIRRSFDLAIAQHNSNIELHSFGADQTYRESEEDLVGVTPAQNSFISKPQNYRIDYEDTKKYMTDHSNKVKYMRVESPQLPEVSENSVAREDLIRCRLSAKKSKVWTNGQKPTLSWS